MDDINRVRRYLDFDKRLCFAMFYGFNKHFGSINIIVRIGGTSTASKLRDGGFFLHRNSDHLCSGGMLVDSSNSDALPIRPFGSQKVYALYLGRSTAFVTDGHPRCVFYPQIDDCIAQIIDIQVENVIGTAQYDATPVAVNTAACVENRRKIRHSHDIAVAVHGIQKQALNTASAMV